ncbi:DUF4136 domain-containing protein [uncultured Eudoraea sp.]|jgi:hypothetical protein|uniref:DUF4136 domain-containing protein n=1 Tax=uncultured Eudoraea sp. TaxID=1035614 RepID=UPI00261B92EB|nr:DUF4136 domain-containing protein [uncultured Eudoraea sp.]
MKKFIISFSVFLVAFLTISQIYAQVTSDYDKTVDFTKFKTITFLGWQDNSDQLINDLDKQRILDSFGKEFEMRNLTFVEQGGELAVTLYLVIDQKTSTTAYTNYTGGMGYGGRWGYGYGMGYGGGIGMGSATTSYSESDYQVGTFVVSVYDGESKKLIWQGISSKTINENPKKREKTIPKGVKKLMKKYPVQPPK